ncbi:MAG: RNA polymerase sigma-70 factor [Alistipes sp.]
MLPDKSDLTLKAFNFLFDKYQQRFIRFAVTYVSDVTMAEDLVMESFAAVWERRATLSVEAFPAYTLTVVKHKCLNHLRSKVIRVKAAEEINSHHLRMLDTRISTLQACDPEELFSEETQRIVNEAIAALPERTRTIFIRSRLQGESYKEIAEAMNITVKSVEFEISKAMKTLRVSLKEYLPVLAFLFIIS